MKKIILPIILSLSVIYLVGCASHKNLVDASTGKIPKWYSNVPQDPNYFFAANSQTSRDMQMAVDKATTAARADIARQVQTKMSGIEKLFGQEVGTSDNSEILSEFTQATKDVTDETLSGTHVTKQKIMKDGNTFRAYVLVEYPIGAANQALMQQLKTNNHLYTRFRASQAFKELDSEVKKYEEWKKNQVQSQSQTPSSSQN